MDSETTTSFITAAESEFERNPTADDNDEIDEAALGHDPEKIEAARKLRDLKRLLKGDSQVVKEALAPPAHKQTSAIQHFVAPLQNLFTTLSAPAAAAQDDSAVEPIHLTSCTNIGDEPINLTSCSNIGDEPIDLTSCTNVEDEAKITTVDPEDAPLHVESVSHPHPETILEDDKECTFPAGAIFGAEVEEKEGCHEEPGEMCHVGVSPSVEKHSEEEVDATACLMEQKIHVETICDEGDVEHKEE